jgi:putative addiction module component (TIGR02574 family)
MNVRDVFKLPAAERIQLAEDLWDSIAADPRAHPPLTDAQRKELEKRLAEHAADPSTALNWDAVRAQLSSRAE